VRLDSENRKSLDADSVLRNRFWKLTRLLRSGELSAEGSIGNGALESIPVSMWSRELTLLDVNNGDLVEYRESGPGRDADFEILVRGLTLKKIRPADKLLHVKPMEVDEVARSTMDVQDGSKISPAEIVRRQSECAVWLDKIIGGSSHSRTKSINELKEEAQSKWGVKAISARWLGVARTEAIRRHNATAWGHAGAPPRPKRKSSRSDRRGD
jgi:hypothetical protein